MTHELWRNDSVVYYLVILHIDGHESKPDNCKFWIIFLIS